MATRPEGRAHRPALPGLRHWLAAAALLAGVMLVVPVLAGLT